MPDPISYGRQRLVSALESLGPVSPQDGGVYESGDGWRIMTGGPDHSELGRALNSMGVQPPTEPESLCIQQLGKLDGKNTLAVYGSDERGLAYALLEVASTVGLAGPQGDPLANVSNALERPTLGVRGAIKYFVSEIVDKEWFYSTEYWEDYLPMLLANRYNRFTFCLGAGRATIQHTADSYFWFPYPFFTEVPGYDVRVGGLSPEERDRNLATLKAISARAKKYGLDFYLGLWSHFISTPEGVKIEYPIEGLSDESHAGYCRDAVKHLLQQCPDIDGVLLRVNFESGIPEGPLDFWDTYIQGIADAGRPVKLDMRAKGITFELIENAQKKGLEVIASTKFTAEHMGLPYHQAQIRIDELERGGRGFTRYGYADLLKRPRDYDVMYRVWMFGTQPVLLWGDPDYVATLARTCAIADGVGFEHSDPLSFMGRRGSDFPGLRYGEIFADKSLQFYRWAFQRYWYTYLMFGRLLYNPSTDAEVWLRELRDRFGDEAAPHIAEALRYASKTLPLVTMSFSPSAMNFAYWPEMFTNLPIVETPEPTHYRDAPDSGRVEPLDTAIFYRAVDYVEDYMSGQRRGRYSPIEVNRWLRGYAANALAALDKAEKVADTTSPELRGIGLDVRVQARLALFFAHRFVATTHYEFYKQAGDYDSLSSAVSAYREALGEWSQIVQLTKGTYRDNLPFREIPSAKGHWADREEAFLEDLRNMEGVGLSFLENYATGPVSFAHVPLRLQRPDSVQVTTTVKGWDSVNRVAVHFRTDPGQPFREVVMGQRPDQPPVYLADLPVDGTPTGPLQYYMTATPGSGETISHPVDGAAKPLEIILSGETPAFRISQTPPKSFRRGGPLKLELQVEGPTGPRGVNLFYRHLNQAEYVQEMAMANEGGVYTATVPGDYTDSPYDLLYYFEIKDQAGGAMMHPGFDEHCSGTPYFVVYAEE